MSWLEKIETDMVITCGDGAEYRPDWVNANMTVEYNIAEFEFKEVVGTLVRRGTPRGARYGIEIFFQGEEHLDVAEDFRNSAADPQPWKIYHPYYKGILVQPIGLTFDNSVENVTRITGIIVETITTDGLKPQVSAPDKIAEDKITTDVLLTESYVEQVPAPAAADRISLQQNIDNLYASVSGFIQTNTDISAFRNAYNQANSTLNTAVFDTQSLLNQVQALANLPAEFEDTLINRMNMLGYQIAQINNTVANILTKSGKVLYEHNMGTLLGAMVQAAVTGYGSYYNTRNGVLTIIDIIYANYERYIANLDTLQSLNGATLLSYIPNAKALNALSRLVGLGVTALLQIAGNARQERTVYLEEDSNCFLLANRFYGLKKDDSTIDFFRDSNDIKLSNNLIIPKGTMLKYYV